MKQHFAKRFIVALTTLIVCLSFTTSAFAAEAVSETSNEGITIVPATAEEMNQARGSISGYAQGTITKENNSLIVWCDSSAIFNSGMGITVAATSANFNGIVDVSGEPQQGIAEKFGPLELTMGREIQIQNLTHRGCSAYKIVFDGLTGSRQFVAKVWIYG